MAKLATLAETYPDLAEALRSSTVGEWRAMANILLTVSELAAALGVSERTVYRWAKRGELPTVKFGNHIKFSPDAIGAAIADQFEENA